MKPTSLTDATFDATLTSTPQPILVDFYADWCGPCRMLGPIIDQLASEQEGKALIVKVNIDDAPNVASRFGITSIPALIVFKDGQPVASARGVQSKVALEKLIGQAS